MSLTPSTTTLDTSWTENSIIAFTAGTLSSVSDMVTEVESKLKRGTLSSSTAPTDTQVQNWLVRAKEELAEVKKFTFKQRYAYCTTVASQYRYALPPDYNGGEIAIRDVTNDRFIALWSSAWFDKKFPNPSEESTNEPIIGCIKNMELWLVPPPNGSYQLEMRYGRSGDDNTPTDFSWLPEIERFRCCDFAIAEAFESIHMFEQALYYRQKWGTGLAKAIRADSKRKWHSMGFSALSVFQENNAMNNQPDNS